MSTRPLYIFDLDGTLALIEHRRHFVADGKSDWDRFYAECEHDAPNKPVIHMMEAVHLYDCDFWIFSGRSAVVREKTVAWLYRHTTFSREIPLRMRPVDDFTPDEELKRRWYYEMSFADRARLEAVFDDRDKVVAMWRSLGVTCFQVAAGNF